MHSSIAPLLSVFIFFGCQTQNDFQSCELSSVEDITYNSDEQLCVQIDIQNRYFSKLGKQYRFGRNSGDQFQGVIGHILTSCTEPFPDPYTYFPADLQVGSNNISMVGVRKKGFVGSVLGGSEERPSLKIKSDKFVEGQLIAGQEKLTLNNNLSDPTRMRTCLTYQIFRDAGYPAPQCNLANVMVNGQSLGVYSHIEDVKEDFLEREFGNSTGSLYEITIVDFTLDYLSDGLGRWEIETDATSEDPYLLEGVANALLSEDEDLEEQLALVLDIEMFITFWALETLLGHADGYSANSNNSFVYFDPNRSDRAVLIPWGPDDAMQEMISTPDSSETEEKEQDEETNFFVSGMISKRLSVHPTLHAEYLNELERLLQDVWLEEEILEYTETYANHIRGTEGDSEEFQSELDRLQNWINSRREDIEIYIDAGGQISENTELTCYSFAKGEDENLNDIGGLATSVSHSCASTSYPSNHFLLLMVILSLNLKFARKDDRTLVARDEHEHK
jgi:spore coat protein CotH